MPRCMSMAMRAIFMGHIFVRHGFAACRSASVGASDNSHWLSCFEVQGMNAIQVDRIAGHPKIVHILHCQPALRSATENLG
ncbi:hypothetical protein SAMN04487951_10993 [Vreelandella arcis]|uniref:Uncharacterized protein n=1 Tax=Vreelandella arcis TaxID=416873 RepID=A0A1H0F2H6_9GAMM|nr:hypothetical protein SAMN04487951_10993 [Halomonas arcis]